MSPCFCDGSGWLKPVRFHQTAQGGFSLIEVLMCLTMLALIMLPFTILMTQTGQVTRGAYFQSTRTILLNSLKSELSPSDPSFATTFTDGSMNTTLIRGKPCPIGGW
jgi:prepilin-type N-terminal cleavage/methylation domain-containing protein